MKGYCTVRDVRLALAPIADWAKAATATSLTDEQISDAIEEAEGVVDNYIGRRYTVPLIEFEEDDPENPGNVFEFVAAPVPVRGITRNVAAFLIALTHYQNKDMPEDNPVRLRYGVALSQLLAIRDDKADLPGTFPPVGNSGNGGEIFNLYEGTMFGLDSVGLGYGNRYTQVYIDNSRDV